MGEEKKVEKRDFVDIITDLRGGQVHQDMTDALNEVSRAVMEFGRDGTVVLKLKVSRTRGEQVVVHDDIKATPPREIPQPTLMFVDKDSNLVREDPNQLKLKDVVSVDGDDVDAKTGEVVQISAAKG